MRLKLSFRFLKSATCSYGGSIQCLMNVELVQCALALGGCGLCGVVLYGQPITVVSCFYWPGIIGHQNTTTN